MLIQSILIKRGGFPQLLIIPKTNYSNYFSMVHTKTRIRHRYLTYNDKCSYINSSTQKIYIYNMQITTKIRLSTSFIKTCALVYKSYTFISFASCLGGFFKYNLAKLFSFIYVRLRIVEYIIKEPIGQSNQSSL